MQPNRIQYLRERLDMSKRKLAIAIGAHPSSIGKLESGEMELNLSYMRKISKALGVAPYELLPDDMRDQNADTFEVKDGSAQKYVPKPIDEKHANDRINYPNIVDLLIKNDPNRSAWTLFNNKISGRGYHKGDLIIVQNGRAPQPGDIVCVNFSDPPPGLTEFMIYNPPFLMTDPGDGTLPKPILHDPDTADILGVVTDLVRLDTKKYA